MPRPPPQNPNQRPDGVAATNATASKFIGARPPRWRQPIPSISSDPGSSATAHASLPPTPPFNHDATSAGPSPTLESFHNSSTSLPRVPSWPPANVAFHPPRGVQSPQQDQLQTAPSHHGTQPPFGNAQATSQRTWSDASAAQTEQHRPNSARITAGFPPLNTPNAVPSRSAGPNQAPSRIPPGCHRLRPVSISWPLLFNNHSEAYQHSLSRPEGRRLEAVSGACHALDLVFLVLHHLSLQKFLDVTKIPPRIRQTVAFDEAMDLFDSWAEGGGWISSRFANHWVKFLSMMGPLDDANPNYTRILPDVITWLQMVPVLWPHFMKFCFRCRHPPTVNEMDVNLKMPISSPMSWEVLHHYLMDRMWSNLPIEVRQICVSEFRHDLLRRLAMPRHQAPLASHQNLQPHRRASNLPTTWPENSSLPATTWQMGGLVHPQHGPAPNTFPSQSSTSALGWSTRDNGSRPFGPNSPTNPSQNPPHPSTLAAPNRAAFPGHRRPQGTSDQTSVNSTPFQPFFPLPGKRAPHFAPPQPIIHALHLSYLQSPELKLVHQTPYDGQRMYQYVTELQLQPQVVEKGKIFQEYPFVVPSDLIDGIAQTTTSNDINSLPTKQVARSSVTLRLRCVGFCDVPEVSRWCSHDCVWPSSLVFQCNDKQLEARTRTHFGRDVPISLNEFVKAGENRIQVLNIIYRETEDAQPQSTVAVEVVRLRSQQEIIQACADRIRSPEETKQAIRESFGNKADDDLACLDETISIGVTDPISGMGMWKTPVRGHSCLHRECFDLETFLESRASADGQGVLSSADVWKCPICGEDARPDVLYMDGWLVEVREGLERTGQLHAKYLVVNKDCEWEAGFERGHKRQQSTRAATSEQVGLDGPGNGVAMAREIVVLD